jgi:glycosyltransferase involved in cell wall biosynthesis
VDPQSRPRVIFCQPALPAYRVDFFDRLAKLLGQRFALYYSPTDMGVLTQRTQPFHWERPVGLMQPLIPGVIEWQPGVMSVPMHRGDTLIVCGGPRTVSTLVLLLKARLRRVKTIWFGHYWSSTSKSYRFYLRMMLMKLAHAVLFYTDQEVEEYRDGFGHNDRRPLSAVNNGINVDPIAEVSLPYRAADRPRDILLIGRIQEKCQADLLIEALADPRLTGVRLQIVGDGPARPELELLAEQLQVSHAVVWHGGTSDEAEIAKVANGCRLFIYPGAVGLSLIHAMAYGLPAIVNNDRWGNMPEITAFEEGSTGVVFARDDKADLIEKIILAIDDAESLDRWSDEALRRAHHLYNTSGMADRVVSLINQLDNAK